MAERVHLDRADAGFPASLLEITDPYDEVPWINVLGDPAVLSGECISIVGARRATPYGLAVAAMAGRVAAECGLVVVSGGAIGCDQAATRAALDAGGTTVIVSGCGADVVYPRSSADIYRDTVEGGGAVVSLVRWGQEPRKYAFPRRNVVIAALSRSLFVTEAGVRSGTMSTADAALALDRLVYAIPGSIYSPNSQGTNHLIAEGALIVSSESDLETRIALDYNKLALGSGGEVQWSGGKVISALVASPCTLEELGHALHESPLTLLETITDYEAKGIIERMVDGRYSVTADAYRSYAQPEARELREKHEAPEGPGGGD